MPSINMIIPAIIPTSLEELKSVLEKVAFAPLVQIDVVDGKFAPFTSWPYEPAGSPSEMSDLLAAIDIEVDLMVDDPINAGREWLEAGAKGLVFHLESLTNPKEALALAGEFNFNLGLSISNDTPVESLYTYIQSADFVQVMGIAKIGQQGQPFDDRSLERIAELSALFPDMTISVDGGVSEATIKNLKTAGATRFVAGSAIFKAANPENKYRDMLKMIE